MSGVGVTGVSGIGDELLAKAGDGNAGRAAATVHTGREQRQTLLALRAGAALAEHENPGDATLLVLRGRVRVAWEGMSAGAQAGDLVVLPESRHAVEAVDDALLLLTVPRGS